MPSRKVSQKQPICDRPQYAKAIFFVILLFSFAGIILGCGKNDMSDSANENNELQLLSQKKLQDAYKDAYENGDVPGIRALFRSGNSGESGLTAYLGFATTGAGKCKVKVVAVTSYEEAVGVAGELIEKTKFDFPPRWFFEIKTAKGPTKEDPSEQHYTIWLPVGYDGGESFFVPAVVLP